jgi:alkanesulfonate monooxygenase SsuD/methylene tetrahydromethanopterin reductase-like flavin-dependent oxidoreductase (luciferase family)
MRNSMAKLTKKPWRTPVIDTLAVEAIVLGRADGSKTKLKFGAFLPPHNPVGDCPTLRRNLDLAIHLDQLGFDEIWSGQHHSSGWEMIGSPEPFLEAVAERTQRISLGTGVVALPYNHPFSVVGSGVRPLVIGTPDEMIRMVRNLREMTGGFGVLLGLAHDWANREGKMRSWDLFARYVMPEFAT